MGEICRRCDGAGRLGFESRCHLCNGVRPEDGAMRECGCKWDGNLNGRLLRCHTHTEAYKREKLPKLPEDVALFICMAVGTSAGSEALKLVAKYKLV